MKRAWATLGRQLEHWRQRERFHRRHRYSR